MPLNAADLPAHISTEFRAPLDILDAGAALPQLYDWHAKENPNFPLFTYNNGGKREFITYAEANQAINRAAHYVASGLRPREAGATPPVVAVLANTDTITYFCNTVGTLRAGATAFLVSTRNGAAAVADMMQRTGAEQLFVSPDVVLREVARDALALLAENDGQEVTMRDMPVFEDLFPREGAAPRHPGFDADVQLPQTFDPESYSVILHSSGSTGHPKPLRWTHKMLANFGREALDSGVDASRCIFGCHGTPMFHALGTFMYSAVAVNGWVLATFKPASPPAFPTPDAVWQETVATKCDYIWTVPSFIEEWARDPEKIGVMQRMGGLMFGGAPLNFEVGDALTAQGVNLFTLYGLTEVGLVNRMMQKNGKDWSYWTPTPSKPVKFVPQGDNKFEVVVVSPPHMPLPAVNTKLDGQDAYATSDLVEPHPTKPDLWRIFGRADEQIILSNGEKTNPLPLEKIINQDPHVKCSIMFGRGKFQNGILIEPHDEFAVDPNDSKQVEAFRNVIWPTVERANEFAPQHSRIFKEMILVTSPSKPFLLNAKGTPRRNVILGMYHDEIEALYKQVEDSAQGDLEPPATWDEEGTRAFVRAVVEHTLRRSIADDADIFRNGGDSLQATWIRNTVLRAIREKDPSAAKRLPMNLVFKAPTISALTSVIHGVVNNAGSDAAAASHTPQDLWKYVEKYSANLPARPANLIDRPAGAKDVVLITGTTGGFGCDALEHLLRDESVERVYAFNRKGSNALERQRKQFRARGLDETLLNSPKFRMVEAALHESGFGVEPELLDEVRRSVTHIMHNAWKVDFNMSIQSFEVDIQGARNLVDLAISSPYRQAPTIVFVSSIGVFMNYKGPVPAPEVPLEDPTSAFGSGYPEGKWVTEHVLQNVTKERGVHTVVMRLGQVSGNRVGYWNEKEWFPSLVKSALFQRCLPDVEGSVAWIPGYESAKAFTEMRHSPEPIVHLVHPTPVPWHTLIAPIAAELGVPLVSFDSWLRALQGSLARASDAEQVALMTANPALRLLDFYRGLKIEPEREPLGMVYLATEKATGVSETLASLPALDEERAKGWLEAWRKAGFL
ncbi:acetyl-CoA synthetase-like protein [Cubamyces sp. BRFM 1775]|nr:acetyl-CoA synthetase-like protein [Cubamyces sp. BRFM 1775]